MNGHPTPKLCIIDSNTLAAIGLRTLLQTTIPDLEVDSFGSMLELQANHPEQYAHFFVAMNMVLEHRPFFAGHARKTIVLTTSVTASSQLSEFHCLCVNVPERAFVHELLSLFQHAHGKNSPHPIQPKSEALLSPREVEVMVLIVKGYINKEIADKLNIGLTTVITHRKNIMEKLKMKSVSALTIYAVMNGYVGIDRI